MYVSAMCPIKPKTHSGKRFAMVIKIMNQAKAIISELQVLRYPNKLATNVNDFANLITSYDDIVDYRLTQNEKINVISSYHHLNTLL